jgi:hypothetical protein
MALSVKTPPPLRSIEDWPDFIVRFKGFALSQGCHAELKAAPATSDKDGVERDMKLKGYLSLAMPDTVLMGMVQDATSTKRCPRSGGERSTRSTTT